MFYALQETRDRNPLYLPEWLNTNSFLPVTHNSLIYTSVTDGTRLLFFLFPTLPFFPPLLLSGHEDADGGCRPQQRWSRRRNCFLSFHECSEASSVHCDRVVVQLHGWPQDYFCQVPIGFLSFASLRMTSNIGPTLRYVSYVNVTRHDLFKDFPCPL